MHIAYTGQYSACEFRYGNVSCLVLRHNTHWSALYFHYKILRCHRLCVLHPVPMLYFKCSGKKVTSLNQQQNMAANTITLDKEVAENNLDTMQVVSADVKNTYSVIIDEEKWETVVLFVEVLKEV